LLVASAAVGPISQGGSGGGGVVMIIVWEGRVLGGRTAQLPLL